MKKWLFSALVGLLIVLTGCTATIYGVPQARWDAMGPKERVAAMEAYRARQEALKQQRAEWARQRELERERQQAIAAEKARQEALRQQQEEQARRREMERERQQEEIAAENARRDALRRQELERERQRQIEAEKIQRRRSHIDAIYRGEGRYGELLRVTLEGGRLRLHRGHEPYRPVSFRIAAGETKTVLVVGLRGRQGTLVVGYDGRALLLDESPDTHRFRSVRLDYEKAWEWGKTYHRLNDHGPLELRGVTIRVTVLGAPPRDRHAGRRPPVIVVRKPSPEPVKPPNTFLINRSPFPRKSEKAVIVKAPPQRNMVEAGQSQPRRQDPKMVAERTPRLNRHEAVRNQPSHPSPAPAVERPSRSNASKETPPQRQGRDLPPSRVRITFAKGELFVKGRACPLIPQSFVLGQGEARTVVLRGRRGGVKIRVSYQEGEIGIDDRPGKGRSATSLRYSKKWRSGSRYRIKTTRNRLLEDLDISVRAM